MSHTLRPEIEARCKLLQSIADQTYPHGFDLRPLATAIAYRWVSIKVQDPGKLVIVLTRLGQTVLINDARLL